MKKRRRPKIKHVCKNCSVSFVIPYKERNKRTFCGHACAAKFHKASSRFHEMKVAGALYAEQVRGTGKKHPYVKRGGRHEHRVVMEEMLGRKLLPHEIVHHHDGDGHNNSPSNLVLTDRSEHARIHFTGLKREPKPYCKYGHALTPENIHITSIGRRQCVICRRKYDREWKQNKREELKRENHPSSR